MRSVIGVPDIVEIPRVDGFQRLHWSWQEFLLSTAWPFLLTALVPGISLGAVGVTSRFRPGWLKASIVAPTMTWGALVSRHKVRVRIYAGSHVHELSRTTQTPRHLSRDNLA
jgi:hypothetical protein